MRPIRAFRSLRYCERGHHLLHLIVAGVSHVGVPSRQSGNCRENGRSPMTATGRLPLAHSGSDRAVQLLRTSRRRGGAARRGVVSPSLRSVGPNVTLVEDDIEAVIHGLKAQRVGEIDVGGPDLARSLTDLGLIDEYRLDFRPLVLLGRGTPFFAGPRSSLRLVASDLIGEDAIRLTYVPP